MARPRIAFVFSGEGGQWVGMGRELYAAEPTYKGAIQECDRALQSLSRESLISIFDGDGAERIRDPETLQHVHSSMQVALARLLGAWGVEPDAVVGHSIGEGVAGYVAGALTLVDLFRINIARNRNVKPLLGRGLMVALEVRRDDAIALATSYGVHVALCNGPRAIVLSGERERIERVARDVSEKGVFCRTVEVPVAGHSPIVDPLGPDMLEDLAVLAPQPFRLPYFSCVRPEIGAAPEDGRQLDAGYWWQLARRTLVLADAIDRALDAGIDTFVEIAPHPVVSHGVRDSIAVRKSNARIFSPLRRSSPERDPLAATVRDLAPPTDGATPRATVFAAARAASPAMRSLVFRDSRASVDRIHATVRDGEVRVSGIGADVVSLAKAISGAGPHVPPPHDLRTRCCPRRPRVACQMVELGASATEVFARFETGSELSAWTVVEETLAGLLLRPFRIRALLHAAVDGVLVGSISCEAFVVDAAASDEKVFHARVRGDRDLATLSGVLEVEPGVVARRRILTAEETAPAVREICVAALKTTNIDDTKSLVALGLDSLGAVGIRNAIEETFGVMLSATDVLQSESVGALTDRVKASPRAASGGERLRTEGAFGLTREQRRFSFLHQLDPEQAEIYATLLIRLRGVIDPATVASALDSMSARHEILRSSFPTESGRMVQRVDPDGRVPLALLDVRRLPEALREQERRRALDAEANVETVIDLHPAPLSRAKLVLVSDREADLVIRIHHILTDFWSQDLYAREWIRTYLALRGAGPMPNAPPAQYRDFVEEEARLEASHPERLQFWRDSLAGAPPYLAFPEDRPRPKAHTLRGDSIVVELSPSLQERVARTSRELATTPFATMLAAFYALLHRFSRQTDMIVGSPTTARNRRDLERTLGPMATWAVVREKVGPTEPFRDLCQRVMSTVIDATANAIALEDLMGIWPHRDRARNPLFQVLFDQLDKTATPQGTDLEVDVTMVEFRNTHFDLAVMLERLESKTEIRLIWYTDLFERETAEALLASYLDILEAGTLRPETTIAALPLAPSLVRVDRVLAVAATFTADLLAPIVGFWAEQTKIRWRTSFAPYGQIFQELLEPGMLAANASGVNVVLFRIEDLGTDFENGLAELADALVGFSRRQHVPTLAVICPSSKTFQHDAVEAGFVRRLRDVPGVEVMTPAEIERYYPVLEVHDPYLYEQAKVPYARPYLAALATAVTRRACALVRRPHAVIVAPCRPALDGFLTAQIDAGALVCLYGSGAQHPGAVSSRIDDRPRAETVKSFAAELGLTLADFILLESDPAVCDAVRAACPEIGVLQLPLGDAGPVLEHYWPFDRATGTEALSRESPVWSRIANTLRDPERIARQVGASDGERRQTATTGYVAPETDVETKLVGIWEEVLKVRPIGVTDDFFERGGDSIQAIQILSRASKIGIQLQLAQLLQHPTVRALAPLATMDRRVDVAELVARLPAIDRGQDFEDAYPLSDMQDVMVKHYSHVTGAYHVQTSSHLEDRANTFEPELLAEAFERAARRQPVMRTALLGSSSQGVQRTFLPQITHVDLRGQQEHDARVLELLREDRTRPFDDPSILGSPRVSIVRRNDTSFNFSVSLHHAFCDAWGYMQFTSSVFEIYAALLRKDEPAAASILEASYGGINTYKEYVALERAMADDPAARAHWEEVLAPVEGRAKKPSARPPCDSVEATVPSAIVRKLRALAQQKRWSLKAILLSAYADLAQRELESSRVCVGVVTNGRTEHLSDMRGVGLFWRLMPVVRSNDESELERIAKIHASLGRSEPFVLFPLQEITQRIGDPIQCAFNYLHLGASNDGPFVRHSSFFFDHWHYPLALRTAVDLDRGHIIVSVMHDAEHVSVERAQALLEDYRRALTRLAGE